MADDDDVLLGLAYYDPSLKRPLRTSSIPFRKERPRKSSATDGGRKRRRREAQDDDDDDDDDDDEDSGGDGCRIISFGPEDDAYGATSPLANDGLASWMMQGAAGLPPRRTLPCSQVLASTVDATKKNRKPIPLLEEFLQRVKTMKKEGTSDAAADADAPQQDESTTEEKQEQETTTDGSLCHRWSRIDDPTATTLKPGHHVRFRQLREMRNAAAAAAAGQSSTASWTELRRREYSKLCKLVRAEQYSYLDAVVDFWVNENRSRVRIGFDDDNSNDSNGGGGGGGTTTTAGFAGACSAFCRAAAVSASQEASSYWKQQQSCIPMTYNGKCHQVISVPSFSSSVAARETKDSFRVDSVASTVVWTTTATTTNNMASSSRRGRPGGDDDDDDNAERRQKPCDGGNGSSCGRAERVYFDKERLAEGVRIPKPKKSPGNEKEPPARANFFLRNDDRALELAVQHDADAIATEETLQVLLLRDVERPEEAWMIPACRRRRRSRGAAAEGEGGAKTAATGRDILVLDRPVRGSFESPRDCLTAGYELAVVEWLRGGGGGGDGDGDGDAYAEGTKKGEEESSQQQEATEFCYTLLVLPPASPHNNKKSCRLLVRSRPRLFYPKEGDDHSSSSFGARAVQFRVHVEYFCSGQEEQEPRQRGAELVPSTEKALWIMDYLLQPASRVVLLRVDPVQCRLAASPQEVSLAHAITVDRNEGLLVRDHPLATAKDPTDHWRALCWILHGLLTVGRGDYVLRPSCSSEHRDPSAAANPSGSSTISIHAAAAQPKQRAKAAADAAARDVTVIDVRDALGRAGQVPLGPKALRRCICRWAWTGTTNEEEERLPYTFPPLQPASAATAAGCSAEAGRLYDDHRDGERAV